MNQVQNDQSKQTLMKSMNKKLQIEKEKQQIAIIEKLGEVAIQSSVMLENQKKEIKQKLELDHQRKVNKLQIQNYNNSRNQQTELVEKHQLIMD